VLPSFDLLIKNGSILSSGELVESDVFLTAGKISAIERSHANSAVRSINARGMILLPGLIDPHVHFRDPGQTYKEDFLSGTRGAAAGGVTTVFDMPNTEPAVITANALTQKARIAKEKSVCNFGLIAGASHQNLDSLLELKRAGAVAFKTYMIAPPKGREKEFAGTFVTDSGQLLKAMEGVRRTGLVHCIHAESESSIAVLTEELKEETRKDPLAHYYSRPNFVEEEAVADALILAGHLGTKTHIVHVSTSGSVNLLFEAKRRGVDVTSETCPQYLFFSKEILNEKGPYAKFNPPPRNIDDMERMIGAVSSGEVEMVSTDHAPHSNLEKQSGLEDIFRAPSGTPGVETRLPLLLNFVHQGKLRLEDIPRMTSTAAARRFGIFPRKGAIQVGSDADIAIVDFDQQWTVRASDLQTKAWETVLYDGIQLKGRVKFTIVNGEVAYEDGSGFATPGIGEMINPS
jgi:allantoinase